MADQFDFLMSLRIDASAAQAQLRQVIEDFAKEANKKPIAVKFRPERSALAGVSDAVEKSLETAVHDAVDRDAGKKAGAEFGRGMVDGLKKAEAGIEQTVKDALKEAMKGIGKTLAAEIRAALNETKNPPATAGRRASPKTPETLFQRMDRLRRIRDMEPLPVGPKRNTLRTGIMRTEAVAGEYNRNRKQARKTQEAEGGYIMKFRRDELNANAENVKFDASKARRLKAIEERRQIDNYKRENANKFERGLAQAGVDRTGYFTERANAALTGVSTGVKPLTAAQLARIASPTVRAPDGLDFRSRFNPARPGYRFVPPPKSSRAQAQQVVADELINGNSGNRSVLSSLRRNAQAQSRGENLVNALAAQPGLSGVAAAANEAMESNKARGLKNPNNPAEAAARAAQIRKAAEAAGLVEKAIGDRMQLLAEEIKKMATDIANAGKDAKVKGNLESKKFELEKELARLAGIRSNVDRELVGPALSSAGALSRSERANNIGPARDELLRQEFLRRAEVVAAQGAISAGLNGGIDQNPNVPGPDELNKKALQQYLNAQQRLRAAQASLAKNRGLEFEQEAARELDIAQKNLLKRQDALRAQLLSTVTPGQVTLPNVAVSENRFRLGENVTVSKAAADSQIETAMRSQFGAAYADRFRSTITSGGVPNQSLQQFVESLAATGKNAPSTGQKESVLRSVGIDSAKFIDPDAVKQAKNIDRIFEELIADSRKLLPIWKDITGELNRAVGATEKMLMRQEKMQKAATNMKQLFRDGFALFGGFSLGYTATQGLRNQANQFLDVEQAQADISSVFQSRGQGALLAQGSAGVALKYGADLLETANAAKALAQAGFTANEAIRELETTLLASRGIGMSIEQVQELQLAIRSVTQDFERYGSRNIDWTRSTLDRISAVERSYAVTGQDLANALKLVLPVADNFAEGMLGAANAIDYVNGLSTVMIENLRITGNQAGNIQKIFFSRLTQPNVLKNLQEKFGAKLGNAAGTDFLPLDQLIVSLGERFDELKKKNPFQAKAFATELSGGRNVTAITTILENYRKVADIAAKSSTAFGEAQARANIATDTLNNTVNRVRTSFDLMFNSMASGSGAAQGLRVVLSGVATLFEELGKGSRVALLGLTGFVGIAFAAARAVQWLGLATVGAGASFTVFAGVLRGLAVFGGPIALALTGVTLALTAIGKYSEYAKGKVDILGEAFKGLRAPNLKDIPQAQQLQERLGPNVDLKKLSDTVVDNLTGSRTSKAFEEFRANMRKSLNPSSTGAERYKFAEEFVKQFATMAKNAGTATADLSAKLTALGVTGVTAGGKVGEALQIAAEIGIVAGAEMQNQITAMAIAVDKLYERSASALQKLADQQKRGAILGALDGPRNVDLSRFGQTRALNAGGRGPAGVITENLNTILKPEVFTLLGEGFSEFIKRGGTRYTLDVIKKEQDRFKRPLTQLEAASALTADTGISNFIRDYNIVGGARAQRVLAGKGSATDAQALTIDQTQAVVNGRLESIYGDIKRGTGAAISNAPEFAGVVDIQKLLAEFRNAVNENSGKLSNTTDGPARANRQIVDRFQSTLFDFVENFANALQKFQFDSEFAKRAGIAFDAGEARIDLARNAIQQLGGIDGGASSFQLKSLFDLVKNIKENEAATRVLGTTERGKESDAQQIALRARRDQMVAELKKYKSGDLSSLFPGESGKQLATTVQELISGVTGAKIDLAKPKALQKIIESLFEVMNEGADMLASREIDIQSFRLSADRRRAEREIGETLLSPTTNAAGRGAFRIGSLRDDADAQLEELIYRREQAKNQQSKESVRQIDVQIQTLKRETFQKISIEAAKTLAQITQQLNQQIRSNISSAISGAQALTKDRSVLGQIFFPDGDTTEEKAANKARAIAGTFNQVLSPLTDTIFNRIVDNFYENLTDSIYNNEALRGIFGFGESRLMKEQTQAAALMNNSIVEGSRIGSMYFKAALAGSGTPFEKESKRAAMKLAGLGGSDSKTFSDVFDLSFVGSEEKSDRKLSNTDKKATNGVSAVANQTLVGLGVQLGAVGGGLAGGGGSGANMGSNLGATVGGILGTKFLGKIIGTTLGGPVGGLLLGLAGGLIGKLFDKKTPKFDAPVIQALEAVERAQKETITTIQSQTDALLSPESRLLNIPSTFNVPSYRPGLGGSGGNSYQIEINVNASGMSSSDAQGMIEDALSNVLSDQRGRRPRVSRLT